MHLKLPFQRRYVVMHLCVPGLEVGISQFEDPEAPVLFGRVFVKQTRCFGEVIIVELLDNSASALFGNICDGRVILASRGFWELDEDKFTAAAILFIHLKDRLGCGTRTSEEIQNNTISPAVV